VLSFLYSESLLRRDVTKSPIRSYSARKFTSITVGASSVSVSSVKMTIVASTREANIAEHAAKAQNISNFFIYCWCDLFLVLCESPTANNLFILINLDIRHAFLKMKI